MTDKIVMGPMSTAPRDRFILLAFASGYTSTPLRFHACRWSSDYGMWRTHSNDAPGDDGDDRPLGWLPLPALWRPVVGDLVRVTTPSLKVPTNATVRRVDSDGVMVYFDVPVKLHIEDLTKPVTLPAKTEITISLADVEPFLDSSRVKASMRLPSA